MSERDQEIIQLAQSGELTLTAIGERYGITRQRVAAIIKRNDPDRERDAHRQLLTHNIADLEKIKRNPKPVHSAIGKIVIDPDTGEPIRDQAIVIASAREQRLQAESIRKLDALDADNERNPELDEYLEWVQQIAAENKQLRDHVAMLEAQLTAATRIIRQVPSDPT